MPISAVRKCLRSQNDVISRSSDYSFVSVFRKPLPSILSFFDVISFFSIVSNSGMTILAARRLLKPKNDVTIIMIPWLRFCWSSNFVRLSLAIPKLFDFLVIWLDCPNKGPENGGSYLGKRQIRNKKLLSINSQKVLLFYCSASFWAIKCENRLSIWSADVTKKKAIKVSK